MMQMHSNMKFVLEGHAAIVAINEAIDKNDPDELFRALNNPAARLLNLNEGNKDGYQNELTEEKRKKADATEAKVIFRCFCPNIQYSFG